MAGAAGEPPAKKPRAEEGGGHEGHGDGHGHKSHAHEEGHGHGGHGGEDCCKGGHEGHGEGHGHESHGGGHGGEHSHGDKGHDHDCCKDGHGHEGGHKEHGEGHGHGGHKGDHGHEGHGEGQGHAGGNHGHEGHGHKGHGEGHESKPHASGFRVPAVVTLRSSHHAAWREVQLPEEARAGMLLSPALPLGPDMRLRRSEPGYETGYHHAVAAAAGAGPVLLLVLRGKLGVAARGAEGAEERVFGPGECFLAADKAPSSGEEAGELPGGHSARVVGDEPLLAAHVKLSADCVARWLPDADVLF